MTETQIKTEANPAMKLWTKFMAIPLLWRFIGAWAVFVVFPILLAVFVPSPSHWHTTTPNTMLEKNAGSTAEVLNVEVCGATNVPDLMPEQQGQVLVAGGQVFNAPLHIVERVKNGGAFQFAIYTNDDGTRRIGLIGPADTQEDVVMCFS